MSEIDTGSSAYLRRAYELRGAADAEKLYDEWADTYESDTAEAMGYVGPAVAAGRLADLLPTDTEVLDAGCGTGLVGAELAKRGFHTIDGLDISRAMLAKARATGAYRHLERADLAVRLPVDADAYGALVCVGTMTQGHVGPEAFAEFVRVTRPGGLVVATVLDPIWERYRAAIDALVDGGVARLVEADRHPYRTMQDVPCRLAVVEPR